MSSIPGSSPPPPSPSSGESKGLGRLDSRIFNYTVKGLGDSLTQEDFTELSTKITALFQKAIHPDKVEDIDFFEIKIKKIRTSAVGEEPVTYDFVPRLIAYEKKGTSSPSTIELEKKVEATHGDEIPKLQKLIDEVGSATKKIFERLNPTPTPPPSASAASAAPAAATIPPAVSPASASTTAASAASAAPTAATIPPAVPPASASTTATPAPAPAPTSAAATIPPAVPPASASTTAAAPISAAATTTTDTTAKKASVAPLAPAPAVSPDSAPATATTPPAVSPDSASTTAASVSPDSEPAPTTVAPLAPAPAPAAATPTTDTTSKTTTAAPLAPSSASVSAAGAAQPLPLSPLASMDQIGTLRISQVPPTSATGASASVSSVPSTPGSVPQAPPRPMHAVAAETAAATASLSPSPMPLAPTQKPPGLVNPGNNCFMNASLQTILASDAVKQRLIAALKAVEKDETNPFAIRGDVLIQPTISDTQLSLMDAAAHSAYGSFITRYSSDAATASCLEKGALRDEDFKKFDYTKHDQCKEIYLRMTKAQASSIIQQFLIDYAKQVTPDVKQSVLIRMAFMKLFSSHPASKTEETTITLGTEKLVLSYKKPIFPGIGESAPLNHHYEYQEDASEFLVALFNFIEDNSSDLEKKMLPLKPTFTHTRQIISLNNGKKVPPEEITSPLEGFEIADTEPVIIPPDEGCMIEVHIQETNELKSLIQTAMSREDLDGEPMKMIDPDSPEEVKAYPILIKKSCTKTPDDLFIQLIRFKKIQEGDVTTVTKDKTKIYPPISGSVFDPIRIDIPVLGDDGKPVMAKDGTPQIQPEQFDIDSFVCHKGSLSGGHYIAYKKFENQWYKYNDDRVEKLEERAVVDAFRNNLDDFTPYIIHLKKRKNLLT